MIKGAGNAIVDFKDYLITCFKHFLSKQSDEEPYYSQETDISVEHSKTKIDKILQEGLDNDIISKEEYIAMTPKDKGAARFYINFKVHKAHNNIPPPRPIKSGSGSITENIGKYVELNITNTALSHESFLEDTPDFLRMVQHINKGKKLPSNTMIAMWDVISLFTNIKHEWTQSNGRKIRN